MSNFWDADPVAEKKAPGNFWEGDALAEKPSVAADVVKSGGVGLAKGTIGVAGAAGDARNILSAATDYVGKKVGASPEAVQSFKDKVQGVAKYAPLPAISMLASAPSSGDIQKGVEGVTGEFYKPKTTAGEYAQTIGEFAPGLIGGGEGLISRLATRVLAPAVLSETAGQATKGMDAEPYARIGGALLSPAALSAGRRAITPFAATPDRMQLVDVLRQEGVPLTAGQRTGNKALQWAESAFGDMPGAGGRPAEMMTNQQEQFTRAALRRAGEDSLRASPEAIDNAFTRIGGQFDAIGARNNVIPDTQFVQDLRTARDEYHNLVGPHARAPAVDNTIADIADQMQRNGGMLTGEQYNAMTSRLARQARQARNDPQLQDALQGLRDSLDDAFERTLTASGNTADAAALREARNQYRNLLVLEKAATGAGSATAEGLLSPSQLRGAVVQQNRRNYARGNGDFADIARAGEAVLRPLPQSGTAPRQNMQHVLQLLGTIVGGGAGAAGGPAGAITGAAAGLAAPALAGRVLMSRPVQAYLGNQALRPGAPDTTPRALVRALLAAGAAPQRLYVSPGGDGKSLEAPQ
jgi:hypothetical protein